HLTEQISHSSQPQRGSVIDSSPLFGGRLGRRPPNCERVNGIEGFYSTPNESFRLTLYSVTLPSLTITFCPTTSTPRMFLTVFADLLTASLIASSNPLLDVPTSSIIFPTGILVSRLLGLRVEYFTLSDGASSSLAASIWNASRSKEPAEEEGRSRVRLLNQ